MRAERSLPVWALFTIGAALWIGAALVLFFLYGTLPIQQQDKVVLPAPGFGAFLDGVLLAAFAVAYRAAEGRLGGPVGGPRSGAAFVAMMVGFGVSTFTIVTGWSAIGPNQHYHQGASAVLGEAATRATVGTIAWWILFIAGAGLAVFDLVLAIPAPESWEKPPPPEPLVQDQSDPDGGTGI